jgi:hypothetical protein
MVGSMAGAAEHLDHAIQHLLHRVGGEHQSHPPTGAPRRCCTTAIARTAETARAVDPVPSPRLDVGAAITDEETAPTPAMMAAADTEIASRRRYVALTVRNVELTRAAFQSIGSAGQAL